MHEVLGQIKESTCIDKCQYEGSVIVLKSGQVYVLIGFLCMAIVTVSVLHSLFIVLTLHGYEESLV